MKMYHQIINHTSYNIDTQNKMNGCSYKILVYSHLKSNISVFFFFKALTFKWKIILSNYAFNLISNCIFLSFICNRKIWNHYFSKFFTRVTFTNFSKVSHKFLFHICSIKKNRWLNKVWSSAYIYKYKKKFK